jgi:ribosomal protein S15P/S13E
MEDIIIELTSVLSRLQIRNERIKEEYVNNEEKIKLLTEEINELLEGIKDNKKS